jgi:hypothetical protein
LLTLLFLEAVGLRRTWDETKLQQKAQFLSSPSMALAVYADHLIPRGLVGRQGKILGCRALVVLHDQEGHPLLRMTHRGDQHLTVGLPAMIARYEQAAGLHGVERIVVAPRGHGG